ncbi:MAG: DUF4238 domain-containing protein [Candidatus Acidiferrales bacterium]|jgi:hypothetical protein
MTFHRDNHYVPRLYLKRFAASPGYVFAYRILVARPRDQVWARCSIKGVAYHAHLYTRIASGVQTDEVEKWLDREFEAPAEEALRKATADMRLTQADWHNLVRFLAAQDVRTPARLAEDLQRMRETVPSTLQDSLDESVRKLESAKRSGDAIVPANVADSEHIPLRVRTEIEPGQEFGKVKGEVIVGRGLWLWSIRHLLTRTASILHDHRWSILRPPEDTCWFTSDDPVVRLNYYRDGKYDFKGGWGNLGTEIFLPLDPRHLLYTKVGERPPFRGSVMPRATAEMTRRIIAEHAHRFIFAASAEADVPKLHPRTVDADLLRHENEQWHRWHEEQTAAERELMDRGGA